MLYILFSHSSRQFALRGLGLTVPFFSSIGCEGLRGVVCDADVFSALADSADAIAGRLPLLKCVTNGSRKTKEGAVCSRAWAHQFLRLRSCSFIRPSSRPLLRSYARLKFVFSGKPYSLLATLCVDVPGCLAEKFSQKCLAIDLRLRFPFRS